MPHAIGMGVSGKWRKTSQNIKQSISLIWFIYFNWPNILLFSFCLLRRREPAEEEDGLGLVVSDEEEEGVVCCEVFLSQHTEWHHARCGCCRLRPLLVHLHKGLMDHCRQEEISFTVHARQICLRPTEHICHAHFRQGLVQLIVFLQLELGQVNDDVWVDVHLLPVGPFIQFLTC